MPEPLAVILSMDPEGDGRIADLQAAIRRGDPSTPELERLGWLLVERARATSDPGFYVLAERAALAMGDPDAHEALLLRGHALHSLHRFRQAEVLARRLVAERGLSFDHGLLGDVLMEQGKLDEALVHYSAMMRERPDAHAYSRAAHMRFLTGDPEGAVIAMGAALEAASPRNAEAWSWLAARLSALQLATGDTAAAIESSEAAVRVAPESSVALLARGRAALAGSATTRAIRDLRDAARRSPQPDILWTLSEALTAAGHAEEANAVDAQLLATGEETDARGFALFLASRGGSAEQALALAKRELEERQDVYTHDAVAWAQFARDDIPSALDHIRRALSEGTRDARLAYHAGRILAAAGEKSEALAHLDRAHELSGALLPSERAALRAERNRLSSGAG